MNQNYKVWKRIYQSINSWIVTNRNRSRIWMFWKSKNNWNRIIFMNLINQNVIVVLDQLILYLDLDKIKIFEINYFRKLNSNSSNS